MAYSGDTSAAIQGWLGRLDGDRSLARNELIRVSYERVRILVHQMFAGYRRVHRWEGSDDVVQGALLKLHGALDEVSPKTTREFYGLTVVQIRRVLLDLARHHFGPEGHARKHLSPPGGEVGSSWLAGNGGSRESLTLEDWSEFHERVLALPPKLREVVELIFYQGLTQKTVAEILGVSEKTVRRRWYQARLLLGRGDGDADAGQNDEPDEDHNEP